MHRSIVLCCILFGSVGGCTFRREQRNEETSPNPAVPGAENALPMDAGGDPTAYIKSISMTEDEIKVLPPAWFGVWTFGGRGVAAIPGGTPNAHEYGMLSVGYRYHSLTFYLAIERYDVGHDFNNRFKILHLDETKSGEGKITLVNQLAKSATALDAVAAPYKINCLYRFTSSDATPGLATLQLRCSDKDGDFPAKFDAETLNFSGRSINERTSATIKAAKSSAGTSSLAFTATLDDDFRLADPNRQLGLCVDFFARADSLEGIITAPSGKSVPFSVKGVLDYAQSTRLCLGLGGYPMHWDALQNEMAHGTWKIELQRPASIAENLAWNETSATVNFYSPAVHTKIGKSVNSWKTQDSPRIVTRSLVPVHFTTGSLQKQCKDDTDCAMTGILKMESSDAGAPPPPTVNVTASFYNKSIERNSDIREFYYPYAGLYNGASLNFQDGYGLYEFFDQYLGQKSLPDSQSALDHAGFSSVFGIGTPDVGKRTEFLFYQFDFPIWVGVDALRENGVSR